MSLVAGTQVYVLNTDSDTVSVISTASDSVVRTLPVGQFPHGRGLFMAPAPTVLAASVLPGGRSVEVGKAATIFATLLNTSAASLDNCQAGLAAGAPAALSLSYQTTNPATNAVTGAPDSPAAITANGFQTFILSFQATGPLTIAQQALDFSCGGVVPAPVTVGVNTVDLTFAATPVPDVVALAATATNDGTVHVPAGGAAAFAVATVNLGAVSPLTVSADTGNAALPVAVTLCQTNPATGQCLAPPSATVAYTAAADATPTFSVFVAAGGAVAFAPGTSRIFVRFDDDAGAAHGSTSVAVSTQ